MEKEEIKARLRECEFAVINMFPMRCHEIYKDKQAVRDRIRSYIKRARKYRMLLSSQHVVILPKNKSRQK